MHLKEDLQERAVIHEWIITERFSHSVKGFPMEMVYIWGNFRILKEKIFALNGDLYLWSSMNNYCFSSSVKLALTFWKGFIEYILQKVETGFEFL